VRGGQRWGCAQHDAIEERKLARGGQEVVGACPRSCHDDLGRAQAQIEGIEQCEMRKEILARARGNPFEQPVGLIAPSVLTGKDREADEVLRRQRVGVRNSIVGGGVGSHHQAGGVIRGEEIAAVVGIGVVAVKRCLPRERALEMGALAGRLVKRQRGSDLAA